MTANHSFASWDIWRFVLSLVSQLSLNISQLKITEEKIGERFFSPLILKSKQFLGHL